MKRFALLLLICWFPACPPPQPSPTPTPSPSPTPTATPTPTPTPTPGGCYPPPSNDPGWTEAPTLPPQHTAVIVGAEAALGSPCGDEPEVTLETLSAQLRAAGLCAGRLDDAVFIRRSDPKYWEEWHTVAYTTGCWTEEARAYRGTWRHE